MGDKAESGPRRTKLESWKEIGVFLGRDARTCQRWEKELGLPVHRFDSSPRSRVFAYADEIERWAGAQSKALKISTPFRRFPPAVLISGAAAVLILIFMVLRLSKPSAPADFRIYGSRLVILDKSQRQIREIDTGFDLESYTTYQRGFQQKRMIEQEPTHPLLIIRDITGDGNPEILFKVQTRNHRDNDLLICYSPDGRVMWRRRIGRSTVFGGRVIENDFLIHGIDVVRFSRRAPPLILTCANHRTGFPGLVTLLDAEGEIRAEFWNGGRINDYALIDVNGDGRQDLVAAGYSREHHCPCCAVLDGKTPGGRSPALDAAFRLQEAVPGRLLAYILLPVAAADKILGKNIPIEWVTASPSQPTKEIRLKSIIAYSLNYQLELTHIKLLDRFLMDLAKYRRAGLCELEPGRMVDALMKENARYFDGEKFVSSPSFIEYGGSDSD